MYAARNGNWTLKVNATMIFAYPFSVPAWLAFQKPATAEPPKREQQRQYTNSTLPVAIALRSQSAQTQ